MTTKNTEAAAVQETPEAKPTDGSLYGKIVTLRSNAIWISPSGKVNLNVFTDTISYKVTKDTKDEDIEAMKTAISMGLLETTDKEPKWKATKPKSGIIPSSLTSEAYKRIDTAGSEGFLEILKHTTSPALLKEMINIEENEGNREEVLKAIKKQLQEISN